MEQAIAEFTWDEAEYLRVTRKYGVSRMYMRNIALGAAAALGMGVALTVLRIHAAFLLYLIAAVYLLYGRWYWKSIPRRVWRNVPGIEAPRRLVFTNDGIATHTDAVDGSEEWDRYRYVAERDDCYLLGQTRRMVSLFVPKRGFSSPRDEASFRTLARSHSQALLEPNSQLDGSNLGTPPSSSR
jgi:hypothetical protein